jgi:hypothetical protein
MLRICIGVFIAAMVSCAAQQSQAFDLYDFCTRMTFTPGTTEFNNCVRVNQTTDTLNCVSSRNWEPPPGISYGFPHVQLINNCNKEINLYWGESSGNTGVIDYGRNDVPPGQIIDTNIENVVWDVCPTGYRLAYRNNPRANVTSINADGNNRNLMCVLTPGQ